VGIKIESATTKLKVMGGPEMDNQKWQAIIKNRRTVSPGKGDQGIKPSRVCRDYEGKAGGEESRKAVCSAAQRYSKENSGV
jgi:hypothetical protein